MIKWPKGSTNRGWSVGDFADAEGARAARDQLRREGIDAYIVAAGAVTFLLVHGRNVKSLMLAALYANSEGNFDELRLIIARLEAIWTDDRAAKAFYTLLEQTAPAKETAA